jgi:hypothetical protein
LRVAKVKKKCTKVLLWNQKNKEAQGEKKRDMKGKQNHNKDSSLRSMQEIQVATKLNNLQFVAKC